MLTMDLPDIEAVAEKVHEAWMESKHAQGIKSRKSESGEELMVAYSQLSEEQKEVDRNTVRAVYEAIRSLNEQR
jgi:RyR domain